MATTPRPVVIVVELLVLAAWTVVDALAGATVLVHQARVARGAGTPPEASAAGDRAQHPALV